MSDNTTTTSGDTAESASPFASDGDERAVRLLIRLLLEDSVTALDEATAAITAGKAAAEAHLLDSSKSQADMAATEAARGAVREARAGVVTAIVLLSDLLGE